ncbi:hypothetical protein SAY86_014142 [Trapa natans]|uniref:Uncharacterized protein n=1 Tax=Trapa natans TaxID=22666 RepID=A0AAN7QMK0_TRANT|nr:hypothetical protein SAY86_014142 [Trapa natans]
MEAEDFVSPLIRRGSWPRYSWIPHPHLPSGFYEEQFLLLPLCNGERHDGVAPTLTSGGSVRGGGHTRDFLQRLPVLLLYLRVRVCLQGSLPPMPDLPDGFPSH